MFELSIAHKSVGLIQHHPSLETERALCGSFGSQVAVVQAGRNRWESTGL